MWAAAAAVVSAAVVAVREPVVLAVVALREPVLLAAAPVVLVHRRVRADPHPLRAPAAPLLAQAVPVVRLVHAAAVPLRRLLSPQSSSVAMAWSSPPRVKPSSSPVRKSR